MKHSLLAVKVVLVLLFGAFDAEAASFDPNNPHTNYRPGYQGNCGPGAACHNITKDKFLPSTLGMNAGNDYTDFCLSCHNSTGEAHDRPAGSASTNIYENVTGLLIPGSYSGSSHSWNGSYRGAKARAPATGGMNTHMPGNKVRCQTCHQAMAKNSEQNVPSYSSSAARQVVDTSTSDNIRFRMLGNYTSTKEYLSHNIMVYRDGYWSTVPNRKTRKKSLVEPSEYTYDFRTGTVTFLSAQPSGSYIYVEIPQPFFRTGNTADAICLDCHNDRKDTRVSHEGDVPGRDHHPVEVTYGKVFGSHTTLRDITSVGLRLQGGKVYCTTCHDPHNAPSGDGSLLAEQTPTALCLDCHSASKVAPHKGRKHQKYANTSSIPTGCADCHAPHYSTNIYLVRDRVMAGNTTVKAAVFRSFTGAKGFGADTGSSICEVCHKNTKYHRSDGSGAGHQTRRDCTSCHKHESGFSSAGGNAPCYGCHTAGNEPIQDIKGLMGFGTGVDAGGKASKHFVRFDNITTSSCLAMCHTADHNAKSPNLKSASELEICNSASCHDGGPGNTSAGRPINMGGRYKDSLHNYTATMPDEYGIFSYPGANCTKCHLPHGSDKYPNLRSSIGASTVGGDDKSVCYGCHDGSSPRAKDIKSMWEADPANRGHYNYSSHEQMNCVNCHGPHGTANSKMVKDSIGGPGLERDATCRACHSGNGGSVYNVMGTVPGSYGPDFSAGSVHNFGLAVAMGGRTVDLTCVGCHDPHNTRNARLLQDRVVFTGVSGVQTVTVPTVSATISERGPITEYRGGWSSYCVVCHTSMDITGGQSPYRRHPVNMPPGPFYPHTTASGMDALPMESGGVSCVSCHYTHGSPKRSLLRFKDAATPEKNLCSQCHDKGTFLGGGPGSHGGFLKNEGNCADCHNMHSLANKKLLVQETESVLCRDCHDEEFGRGLSRLKVWGNHTSKDPMRFKGTGGTFGHYSELTGGTAKSIHDINEEASPAPGGVTTQHRCGTCHNPHGSTNYRILRTALNNVTGIRVYASTDTNGNFLNYSTGMVGFCSACHSSYKVTNFDNPTSTGRKNWIRHPVGVSLKGFTTVRSYFINNTSYSPKVELEAGETISCVSCHFAHGSGAGANLKYPGSSAVNLCKTCHDRDRFGAGTPGSHAGFTGNDGSCSDCHSMHAETKPKLLKDSAETAICVDCHDSPGTSTNPNPSRLDVWKEAAFGPSTSCASWYGTGGSFGSYNPVNGGTAYSMHPVNSDARIAPGDSATVVHCGTCHDTHGSGNFRLLKTKLNGKYGISVTGSVDAEGRTTSYGGGMSGFCTTCHKAYINYGTSAGYTRHPVDVALTSREYTDYMYFGGDRLLPLESGNKVTCITCHFAHGSPNPDMLRLPGNRMCQICHVKGLDSTAGYQEVMYTHGGFNGRGGNCAACHSMHSRNNRKLLLYAEEAELCYSCHGPGGTALQVWKGDAPATPAAWDGTAGSYGASFNAERGGSISSMHMITRTDSPAPGGTTTEHHCGTCHNPHGNNNYRLLRDDVNGRSGVKVSVNVFGRYSSGISSFCAACHTVYGDTGSGVDGYRRHPVNKAMKASQLTNLSGVAGGPKAQTESKKVMCLSCHFSHGSPSYAMLRMLSYSSSEGALCQQCHKKGYNPDGSQVKNTHGGFNGNGANCKVCHSTHAKNNKKLLVESKESKLCDNCHAGTAKFNAFRAEDPDVRVDAPSRFNVFTSYGNSFGSYSAGGGDVVSWHAVDGTHTAPGGKTLELRCGKCHNPHGENNFVMLRNTIENVTGIRVFGRLSSTGAFNAYSSGFGKFCSACHTRLTRCGTGNPWTRHPVDFKLKDKQYANWSTTDILPRLPLEAGSQVTCITCHNSHGSKNYFLERQGGNRMCQQCHKR